MCCDIHPKDADFLARLAALVELPDQLDKLHINSRFACNKHNIASDPMIDRNRITYLPNIYYTAVLLVQIRHLSLPIEVS